MYVYDRTTHTRVMIKVNTSETMIICSMSHVSEHGEGLGADAGRDWGQEEKGTTEDKMAGCYH